MAVEIKKLRPFATIKEAQDFVRSSIPVLIGSPRAKGLVAPIKTKHAHNAVVSSLALAIFEREKALISSEII